MTLTDEEAYSKVVNVFFADFEVGVMEIIGDSSNQQLDNRFDLLGHSLETA